MSILLLTMMAAAQQANHPACAKPAPGPVQAAAPDLNSIVQHMEQAAEANRENAHAYTITRDYQFYGRDPNTPASEVTAQISYVPPTTKEFKILEARGNSRGENVVRHILQDEANATESGKAPGAVTSENYQFSYLGETQVAGRDCYLLGLQPKRAEKSLLKGRACIDKQTYLVLQMDGDMAKLPSWWLKAVHLTLDFGALDGMWIQERTRAVADVRVFGTHVLNARAVKFESGTVNAAKRSPRRSRADYSLGAVMR